MKVNSRDSREDEIPGKWEKRAQRRMERAAPGGEQPRI